MGTCFGFAKALTSAAPDLSPSIFGSASPMASSFDATESVSSGGFMIGAEFSTRDPNSPLTSADIAAIDQAYGPIWVIYDDD